MRRVRINLDNVAENGIGGVKRPGKSNPTAGRIDLLRARVDILTGRDRAIMKFYLENGSTFSQMARLAGVNEATIARRIHKLTKRLLDGEYIVCLRNRDKFSAVERAIAKDYFLDGNPQTKIAAKRKISVYRVRKTLNKIQRLVEQKGQEGKRKDW